MRGISGTRSKVRLILKANIRRKKCGMNLKFIQRGNVMDLAVGVIIGGAFGSIVEFAGK